MAGKRIVDLVGREMQYVRAAGLEQDRAADQQDEGNAGIAEDGQYGDHGDRSHEAHRVRPCRTSSNAARVPNAAAAAGPA